MNWEFLDEMKENIAKCQDLKPLVISGPEESRKIRSSIPAVYVFRIVEGNPVEALKMFRTFRDSHHATDGREDKYNLTGITEHASPNEVFYVGKVRGNLYGRMKNHWESNSARTGSLHLCRWTEGKIRFETDIYQLPERFPVLADIFENEFKLHLTPTVGSRT
ncbi:hypothetical protein [Pelagimonas varians]|uniref:hypothetical protein n=1 Tax=Pelagimonas varians TaxID=696760 RepID=UPI0011B5B950|nr:hypothetical protein [Pelagimonas varians]